WATPAVASTKVQAIAMALLNTVDILIWFGSRPYRGLGPGAGKERKCNPCGSNKEVPCYCACRSGNEGLLPYKEKTPAFPVIGMPGPWKDGWLELLRYQPAHPYHGSKVIIWDKVINMPQKTTSAIHQSLSR